MSHRHDPPDRSTGDHRLPMITVHRISVNSLTRIAVPDGAKRRSMSSPEWRSGWCAFVKSAKTIHKIVEATLALETMIKTEYISNSWWWYWSSVSAAAKTSTIAAIAFRVYLFSSE